MSRTSSPPNRIKSTSYLLCLFVVAFFLSAVASSQAAAAAALASTTTSVAATNGQQKDTTWTKLFVGGLPYHTTDKSLRVSDHLLYFQPNC